MRKQSGFTLIELMIVVAIVGILAAIAIPAYKDFQVRSKVSEVLAAMGACKTTVAEFYQSNNGWVNRSGTDIATDICSGTVAALGKSRFLADIVVSATGVITATTQNTGADNEGDITMEPVDSAGGAIVTPPAGTGATDIYEWWCGRPGAGTTLESRFLPGSCQG